MFASCIPWFASIWLMTNNTVVIHSHLNAVKCVIYIIHAIAVPFLQLIFSIINKHLMDLNREGPAEAHQTLHQLNLIIVSHFNFKRGFDVLDTRYDMTSVVFRAMGVKIGGGGGGGWIFGGQRGWGFGMVAVRTRENVYEQGSDRYCPSALSQVYN
ncbi:hypothetical protein FIBSPDRAFT_938516 [Athelia psychrophila]|uniref:Uncharacterized protein n=1 Tax=Athelia psychrophila TaxID=1759441 RepID=A0A165YBP8_9AGAM|nr:hypothetical protein FIBSPDRAFT_938516 [Fibularhizoctonia sp. CBS 109695]